jgi:hypothetical protein
VVGFWVGESQTFFKMSFRYIFIALMVICLSHSAVATETLIGVVLMVVA